MQKTYTHITLEERAVMQVMLEQGLSLRAIARRLSRAPSSIAREFTRNNGCLPDPSAPAARGRPRVAGGYRCAGAQRRAQVLRSKARVQRKMVCGNAVWTVPVHPPAIPIGQAQAAG